MQTESAHDPKCSSCTHKRNKKADAFIGFSFYCVHRSVRRLCRDERQNAGGKCGPDAKLWKEKPADPCDCKLSEAIDYATRAADTSGLPQTVYRNETSGGWWHTNFAAPLLDRAELSVTMLPARYFVY